MSETSVRCRALLRAASVLPASVLTFGVLSLLMSLSGCRAPSFDSSLSAQQEDKVGEWASADLAGQYPDPPDPGQSARVAAISRRLLQATDSAHAPSIHVTLLREDLPEGFSLPGGWVYVTTGLTTRLHGDDALAAVIAHEIAHAEDHDAAQALVATLGKDTVIDMLTQGKYDDLANVSVQLTHFSHPRGQEEHADTLGLILAARAGYAPQGLTDAVATLQSAGPPDTATWAHVHPNDRSSVLRLEKSLNLTGSPTGNETIETNH